MAAAGYLMQAINLYDAINIKAIRSVLSGKVLDSSPQSIELQYAEFSYLFVYRFGCVVFFNMTNDEINRETSKLKAALGEGLPLPTTESYQVNVGDFPAKVEFEYVELKRLSLDHLKFIAMTVGQSAALEAYELAADRMVNETSSFMRVLAQEGSVPFQTKNLLRIIGSTASTRQIIISNLSILDPPDETWKSKELEKFFRELQGNFDIDTRFKTLDRKLTLVQDNIEILADLTAGRRSMMLEGLVVLLILLEVALAVFHRI